jgi:hypothetical protein
LQIKALNELDLDLQFCNVRGAYLLWVKSDGFVSKQLLLSIKSFSLLLSLLLRFTRVLG